MKLTHIVASLSVGLLVAPAAFATSGSTEIDPMVFRVAIFVLAAFVGYYVVWAVTPALHTPLMSVTNAISAVVVVGAIIAVAASVMSADPEVGARTMTAKWLGAAAVMFACINIFGGFMVTNRMLAMYKKKERPAKKPDAAS